MTANDNLTEHPRPPHFLPLALPMPAPIEAWAEAHYPTICFATRIARCGRDEAVAMLGRVIGHDDDPSALAALLEHLRDGIVYFQALAELCQTAEARAVIAAEAALEAREGAA